VTAEAFEAIEGMINIDKTVGGLRTQASAVRMIAKAELTGSLGKILPTSPHGEVIMLGNLTSEDGIGWRALGRSGGGGCPMRAGEIVAPGGC
jgi:hypothetical protein